MFPKLHLFCKLTLRIEESQKHCSLGKLAFQTHLCSIGTILGLEHLAFGLGLVFYAQQS